MAGDKTPCPGPSLQAGVKHQGHAGQENHFPAKEGRKGGRVSARAVGADPLLLAPPRALGQNASLQCGHQPSRNWRNASTLPSCSSALLVAEQMITEMQHMGPKVTGHSGKVTLCYPGLGGRGPSASEHSFSLCSSQGRKVTSPEPPEKEMCAWT